MRRGPRSAMIRVHVDRAEARLPDPSTEPRPAHGGAAARERHSDCPRAAEARPASRAMRRSRRCSSDPPEWVLTAKVFDLLLAVPKCGRVKAGAAADDLPHLAVEDGRRAVRAPARPSSSRCCAGSARAPAIAILFVISGPSGAGKGTLIHGVLDRDPDIAAVAVSATTRRQREGEEDGREYYFLSDDEFQRPRRRRRVRGARLVRRRPLRHAEGGGRPAAGRGPQRHPRARGGGRRSRSAGAGPTRA